VHRSNEPTNGSALLLVLFTILLISSLIISAVEFVKHDVDEYSALSHRFRAAQLAESGIAFGCSPQVKNEDRALLDQRTSDGGEFRVSIASESTKLNINFVLQNGREYLLEELFTRWGVPSRDAQSAIDALQTWVSPPGSGLPDRGSSGSEAQANSRQKTAEGTAQDSPAQTGRTSRPTAALVRPFQAVEEMSLAEAFGPVMSAQPNWANYFTVWGDGKIDVNLANAETISLVTGIAPAQAEQFVKYRWGPDGIPFTQDDRDYQSLDQVRVGLGMSPEQFQLIQDLLALNSAIDRIESTGIIGGYSRTITVITNRNSAPIRYLLWQES
jgi:general secretion pathway protein K